MLISRTTDDIEALQTKFCGNESITRSCHGIDTSQPIPKKNVMEDMVVNGKKIPAEKSEL